MKVYRCTQIANVKCQELMEKIQAALNHASGEGRPATVPSTGAQQSSIKSTTQDHPTVHTTIERKDHEAVTPGPSMRQKPDVRKLVRLMLVQCARLRTYTPSPCAAPRSCWLLLCRVHNMTTVILCVRGVMQYEVYCVLASCTWLL